MFLHDRLADFLALIQSPRGQKTLAQHQLRRKILRILPERFTQRGRGLIILPQSLLHPSEVISPPIIVRVKGARALKARRGRLELFVGIQEHSKAPIAARQLRILQGILVCLANLFPHGRREIVDWGLWESWNPPGMQGQGKRQRKQARGSTARSFQSHSSPASRGAPHRNYPYDSTGPRAKIRHLSPRRHGGHGDFTEASGFSVHLRVAGVSVVNKVLEFSLSLASHNSSRRCLKFGGSFSLLGEML